MLKKFLMMSVLVASSACAMDGQTLQVVGNTAVAKTIRWLSSGTPVANAAAVAIGVCVAKSALETVTWPVRAWWGWQKDCDLQDELKAIKDRLDVMKTGNDVRDSLIAQLQGKGAGPSCAAAAEPAPNVEELTALKQRLGKLEAMVPAAKKEVEALTAKIASMEMSHQQNITLVSRVSAIETAHEATAKMVEGIRADVARIQGSQGQSSATNVAGFTQDQTGILRAFIEKIQAAQAVEQKTAGQSQDSGSQGIVKQMVAFHTIVPTVQTMQIDVEKLKGQVAYIGAHYVRREKSEGAKQ